MKHETNMQDAARVQDWENRAVKGAALACKSIYEDNKKEAEKLRARQEAYKKSLPTDPIEGMSEINRALKDTQEVDSLHYAPRAALEIIRELSMKGSLDGSQQMSDAVFWLTTQAIDGLTAIEEGARRSRDIAYSFHPMHQPYEA
ncbi:hypothetical protein [uncultured Roseobacter sp.]|uniref:hypothetical protein n=1 Tax=uncultured Roseobacter sp. TaxID=114847 RepID=UPI00262FF125|nr:hypothetical protein [uncultured Roseobacter sp.]